MAENLVVQVDCTAIFLCSGEMPYLFALFVLIFAKKSFSELFGIEYGNTAFHRVVLNVLIMSSSLGNLWYHNGRRHIFHFLH